MANYMSILNSALSRMGASPVSTDQDTPEAKVVAANYADCRDFVLEDREWSFASDIVVLNLDPNPPLGVWTYQYIIPAGVLRVVRVYRDPSATMPLEADDWARKKQRVLSNWAGTIVNSQNQGPLYAEVLTRVDESVFSPGMVQALVEYIISVTAMAVTENKDIAKAAAEAYLVKVSDAAAMDGSQGKSQRLVPVTLPGRRPHVFR